MKAKTDANVTGGKSGTGTPVRRAVHRASLHEQVAEKLRGFIARGDLAAGERINEVAIAEALGVSRTPLREAVKLLASEGLLELLPGRGARVRRLSPEEIIDIFEVIGALESHAVECFVQTMTPRALAEVENLHRRMADQHAKHDSAGYFASNQKMHALLVRLSGSATLEATHATLAKTARLDRDSTLTSDQRWAESMAEHEGIVAAIRARRGTEARELMLQHARRTGAALADLSRTPRSAKAIEQTSEVGDRAR